MGEQETVSQIGKYKILQGDCLQTLKKGKENCIQCCVTSPPYYGLRDYGHDGQIGLEETPDAYVTKLVTVFREVRRLLCDDGTLWLNLGDSYAAGGNGGGGKNDTNLGSLTVGRKVAPAGYKPKDLIGIPWRVAFALQADGWYLRQDIIWHKPNPMPESVRDRCTKAHEYIFLLSKSSRYYFDADAIKELSTSYKPNETQRASTPKNIIGNMSERGVTCTTEGLNMKSQAEKTKEFRNRRSVWTVSTKPFKGAHFATFPTTLVEPCILAGCPKGGTVLDPFGGSGTTACVAIQNARNAILCEINPEYIKIAENRIGQIG